MDDPQIENAVLRMLREVRREIAQIHERLDAQREDISGLRSEVSSMRAEMKEGFRRQHVAIGKDYLMLEDHEDRIKALEAKREG